MVLSCLFLQLLSYHGLSQLIHLILANFVANLLFRLTLIRIKWTLLVLR